MNFREVKQTQAKDEEQQDLKSNPIAGAVLNHFFVRGKPAGHKVIFESKGLTGADQFYAAMLIISGVLAKLKAVIASDRN